jgi:hypothetical protein
VSHDGGTEELDEDIEDDDEGVLEVFDGLFFVDVELLLEEHGLKGVDADEDEGEHEVVDEAAEEVASCNSVVQLDPVAT